MKKLLLFATLVGFMVPSNAQLPSTVQPFFWYKFVPGQGYADVIGANSHQSIRDTLLGLDSQAINYNAALRLNNNQFDFKVKDIGFNSAKFTMMMVYKLDSASLEAPLFTFKQDSTAILQVGPKKLSRYSREISYNDSMPTKAMLIVTEGQIRGASANSLIADLVIGRDVLNRINGHVAEMLVFNGKMRKADREMYETYLAIKYGITLQGDYYRTSSDSTIWEKAALASFHNDIIGIGRDSVFGLTQYRSKNEGIEFGTMFNRDLPESNFILMGSNANRADRFQNDTLQGAFVFAFASRTYKVSVKGDSIKHIPTYIKLNDEGFKGRDTLIMAIKRNELLPLDFYFVDSIGQDGSLFFNEVYFDTDGSGFDEIYFAIEPFAPIAQSTALNSNGSFGGHQDDEFESGDRNANVLGLSPTNGAPSFLRLKAFPNPTTGDYTITVDLDKTEPVTISITDMVGRQHYRNNFESKPSYELKGVSLPEGTYLLTAESASHVEFLKLIIYR